MQEGELRMEIGSEVFNLKPGDVVTIPPNVPHNGKAVTECRIIDVFHPMREDYI